MFTLFHVSCNIIVLYLRWSRGECWVEEVRRVAQNVYTTTGGLKLCGRKKKKSDEIYFLLILIVIRQALIGQSRLKTIMWKCSCSVSWIQNDNTTTHAAEWIRAFNSLCWYCNIAPWATERWHEKSPWNRECDIEFDSFIRVSLHWQQWDHWETPDFIQKSFHSDRVVQLLFYFIFFDWVIVSRTKNSHFPPSLNACVDMK